MGSSFPRLKASTALASGPATSAPTDAEPEVAPLPASAPEVHYLLRELTVSGGRVQLAHRPWTAAARAERMLEKQMREVERERRYWRTRDQSNRWSRQAVRHLGLLRSNPREP